MTNPDTNTLNGSLEQLGITMAANLTTKGVSGASASDGLTTLAGKILNVPGGGGGGLDLDTAVSLTSSSASITLGQSVTLTSVLSASYDSTVDLEGVLIGGTVSFKSGNTVLGTDATDSSGEATYTYTPASVGTYTLKAVFSGTADYDACESSTVSVVVSQPVTPASVTIASDKSILSYYDSESATLSATVLDSSDNPIEGVTVTFYKGTTSIGTADTNSSGVATKTYASTGVGDVSFTAGVGSLVSETYVVEDCKYWNDGSSVGSLEVGSNVSCTSNGEYITITTNRSGEKDVKIPVALSGDWEFETTLAENLPSGSQLTFKIGTGQQWGAFNPDNTITVNLGSSQNFNKTVSKGMVSKITYVSGVMTVYWNNEQLTSKTLTLGSNVKMGYYTNNGRYQYIKDIKLKAL